MPLASAQARMAAVSSREGRAVAVLALPLPSFARRAEVIGVGGALAPPARTLVRRHR